MDEYLIYDIINFPEFQNWFTALFPYLKVELEINTPASLKTGDEAMIPDRSISSDRSVMGAAIKIGPASSVKELKKIFKEHLRCDLKLFRRYGHSWIQPTLTEDWSLQMQNEMGRELCFHLHID